MKEKVISLEEAAATVPDGALLGLTTSALDNAPKAMLAWDKEPGEWVLSAIHPGSFLAEVKENAGFTLRLAEPLISTPPPTERELMVLRTTAREKLHRICPEVAEQKIRGS